MRRREVSAILAESGVVPANLRIAALGRIDLAIECLTTSGEITAAGREHRAFYRPHCGFPFWRPSDDRQEVLDEALVWAAKSGRTDIVPLLTEHGARLRADPYRGTPLIWAAANGQLSAATWLLDAGADVNQRATFGGLSHGSGVTALHLAAQSNNAATVHLLLARSADPTIENAQYHSTAAGWAEHEGAARAVAMFRAHVASSGGV